MYDTLDRFYKEYLPNYIGLKIETKSSNKMTHLLISNNIDKFKYLIVEYTNLNYFLISKVKKEFTLSNIDYCLCINESAYQAKDCYNIMFYLENTKDYLKRGTVLRPKNDSFLSYDILDKNLIGLKYSNGEIDYITKKDYNKLYLLKEKNIEENKSNRQMTIFDFIGED